MRSAFSTPVIIICALLLSGCVATAPIKGAKVGLKAATKTVKTTAKAGALIIPDGKENEDKPAEED